MEGGLCRGLCWAVAGALSSLNAGLPKLISDSSGIVILQYFLLL